MRESLVSATRFVQYALNIKPSIEYAKLDTRQRQTTSYPSDYKSFNAQKHCPKHHVRLPSLSTMLFALGLFLLLHISLAQRIPFYPQEPLPCGRTCRFHLCQFQQRFVIAAPNVVNKVTICRFGEDLQEILEVGEASIKEDGKNPVLMSEWRPSGLDTPFGKRFFGVRDVPGHENPGLFSKKIRGNQYDMLGGTCIVLPIEKYTVSRQKGPPRTILGKSKADCLSFAVFTSDIIVELEWFSGDDLDLSVEEPDGTIVNFRKLRSGCGRLALDNCIDCCGLFGSSRERIHYDKNCAAFQKGEYTAVIRHSSNCRMHATSWVLRVIENGVVVKRKKGESDKDAGELAGKMKFMM